MRKLYAEIDLHSNNNYLGILDQEKKRLYHIRELQGLNLRFILGAKPVDRKTLFADLRQATDDGQGH